MRRMKLMTPLTPRLAQGIGPVRAALGLICLSRWSQIQAVRNTNANFVAAQGVTFWHLPKDAQPSWLRLRTTLRDKKALNSASYKLRRGGFRAGNFNWPALDARGGRFPWAAQAAHYGIDVPIHQNMSSEDLAFVVEVLTPLVTGRSR